MFNIYLIKKSFCIGQINNCLSTSFVQNWHNLLTAITSRVATLISASSKDHVTIEYHVLCLVFCMYSTLYSVQYGEILLS